jgi:hypothetical protein
MMDLRCNAMRGRFKRKPLPGQPGAKQKAAGAFRAGRQISRCRYQRRRRIIGVPVASDACVAVTPPVGRSVLDDVSAAAPRPPPSRRPAAEIARGESDGGAGEANPHNLRMFPSSDSLHVKKARRAEPRVNLDLTPIQRTWKVFPVLFVLCATNARYKFAMTETFIVVRRHRDQRRRGADAFACVVLALLGAIALMLSRAARERSAEAARRDIHTGELKSGWRSSPHPGRHRGRVHTMGEVISGRQSELARAVSERLDSVTHRIGQSMQASTQHTMENLAKPERAPRRDRRRAEEHHRPRLAGDSLARGARQQAGARRLRQGRMEAIVQDGLPKGSFQFQFTLSNGKRPDCAVFLPSDERPLIIDAKFPLEAISALRDARSDEQKKHAAARLRQDVTKAFHRHRGALPHSGRDPGPCADVRAVGVGLCRAA